MIWIDRGEEDLRKRIDEISMMKGFGILFVIMVHMMSISGIKTHLLTSIFAPVMLNFYLISGYTTRISETGPLHQVVKRAKRLLIPYYQYSAVMLAVYFVIYVIAGGRSLAWYGDGAMGILFQLQSVHLFDPASAGVHPMFYGALIGWFVFQMMVSDLIFIPLVYFFEGKKRIYKFITAVALLAAGAVLYILNLQGLNGEYFPPVCKGFVLPNIPGVTGLLLLGNLASSVSLLDFDLYTKKKKLLGLLTVLVIALFVYTDDQLYDFPIGKWGAFGPASYFLAPIYSIALMIFLGIILNRVKRISPVKRFLSFYGDRSMDYLTIHFFSGYLIAYIGGFWYDFLTQSIPEDNPAINRLHFAILIIAILPLTYVQVRLNDLYRLKRKSHKSQSLNKEP